MNPTPPEALWDNVLEAWDRGARFAGLVGDGEISEGLTLHALLADEGAVDSIDIRLAPGTDGYPALTPDVPAAFWYERALHDLYGITPLGHPRLDPLVLPRGNGRAAPASWPSPGAGSHPMVILPDEQALPSHVMGAGMFSIPHGPVRSGVFESVEYVVETPGEDIPHVNVRPHFKHRGLEVRFESLGWAQGVLLAEQVEGIASVAHALAYCHAIEQLAGAQVPPAAQLIRVLHAELERLANHLDVAMRLCDAAGLAVATARFGLHKERILRLISALCGNRFGRGVVVPGGVRTTVSLDESQLRSRIAELRNAVLADAAALMTTASFLDRLRGTGYLDEDFARSHELLGPVGRASGLPDDARWHRSYDGYAKLTRPDPTAFDDGDAMARLRVRWHEVSESFDLLNQVVDLLDGTDLAELRVPAQPMPGQALGWAEAPQGEVLYLVRVDTEGRLLRCAPRSASFHNLSVFSHAFVGDILTDFPFIEASFGLSIAGVVM